MSEEKEKMHELFEEAISEDAEVVNFQALHDLLEASIDYHTSSADGESDGVPPGMQNGDPKHCAGSDSSGRPGYATDGSPSAGPGNATDGSAPGGPGYAADGSASGSPDHAVEGSAQSGHGYAADGFASNDPDFTVDGSVSGGPEYSADGSDSGGSAAGGGAVVGVEVPKILDPGWTSKAKCCEEFNKKLFSSTTTGPKIRSSITGSQFDTSRKTSPRIEDTMNTEVDSISDKVDDFVDDASREVNKIDNRVQYLEQDDSQAKKVDWTEDI